MDRANSRANSRANTAEQILRQVRKLRQTAAENDLGMIVYLLDMVAIEAHEQMTRVKPES